MQNKPSGMIRAHSPKLEFSYQISDAVIIGLTLLFALYAHGINLNEQYALPFLISIICFSFFGRGLGIYCSQRGVSLKQLIWPILTAWIISVAMLILLGFLFKVSSEYSRIAMTVWFFSSISCIIIWRLVVRSTLSYYRSKGYNTRSVAIVGTGTAGDRIGRVIDNTPSFGLKLIGYYDNRKNEDERVCGDLAAPLLGGFDDLICKAKSGEYDLIYLAISLKGEKLISKLIKELADTSASVHLVPDFFIFDLLHSRWINLGQVPTISVSETPFFGVDGWLKRTEDIILSSLILIIIAIPMLLIAIGVKLSSPGPILFKQHRYGMDGKPMRIWKFRSMTVCDDGASVIQAKKGDARITRYGSFLRRTSLDELPQFFNVLMGEMSVVGPRPHAVAHNEEYRKIISGYMLRHRVKPGITGWAQVNGWRGETDSLDKMEKRVEHDMSYIQNWSLWLDLNIVFRTIFTGFVGKNAY